MRLWGEVSNDERNRDTELLASMLCQAWRDANNAGLPSNDIWYRVAALAKQLCVADALLDQRREPTERATRHSNFHKSRCE
jgi:hypothetical protein